jgi:hypothetical protein
MKILQEKGIYACGTVEKQRVGMPKDFKNKRHMKRGEFDARSSSSGITVTLWKDRKGILFLSDFHDPRDVSTAARKNTDWTSEGISCPEIMKQYNANMEFVDNADMLKSLYEIDRKSQTWWL